MADYRVSIEYVIIVIVLIATDHACRRARHYTPFPVRARGWITLKNSS
jgi:hypothetical protein